MSRNTKTLHSRRKFIKTKLLGAFALVSGVPLKLFGNPATDELKDTSISNLADFSWQEIRDEFSFDKKLLYLNTASHGPSPKSVVDRLCVSITKFESKVKTGDNYREKSYKRLATFLNTTSEQVAITSNTTESINIIARSLDLKKGDEVIISDNEHIGGSAPWIALIKDLEIKVKIVKLDLSGKENLSRIKQAVSSKTKVISISHVTCTTGLCLPVKEVVKFCRQQGIYSCIDGAQAVGMIDVDLADLDPDFYASCGHKWLMGPKGTGILYIKKEVLSQCKPTFVGAYSDSKFDLNTLVLEYRQDVQRSVFGTRNIPVMIGLTTALDFIDSIGIKRVEKRGKALANRFIQGLKNTNNISLLSPQDSKYATSIVSVKFLTKNNRKIRIELAENQQIEFRHIYENDLDCIRLSFSIFNNEEEVDKVIQTFKAIAEA